MLHRKGGVPDALATSKWKVYFAASCNPFYDWVPQQRHIEMIGVDYNSILQDSLAELSRVTESGVSSTSLRWRASSTRPSIGIEHSAAAMEILERPDALAMLYRQSLTATMYGGRFDARAQLNRDAQLEIGFLASALVAPVPIRGLRGAPARRGRCRQHRVGGV